MRYKVFKRSNGEYPWTRQHFLNGDWVGSVCYRSFDDLVSDPPRQSSGPEEYRVPCQVWRLP